MTIPYLPPPNNYCREGLSFRFNSKINEKKPGQRDEMARQVVDFYHDLSCEKEEIPYVLTPSVSDLSVMPAIFARDGRIGSNFESDATFSLTTQMASLADQTTASIVKQADLIALLQALESAAHEDHQIGEFFTQILEEALSDYYPYLIPTDQVFADHLLADMAVAREAGQPFLVYASMSRPLVAEAKSIENDLNFKTWLKEEPLLKLPEAFSDLRFKPIAYQKASKPGQPVVLVYLDTHYDSLISTDFDFPNAVADDWKKLKDSHNPLFFNEYSSQWPRDQEVLDLSYKGMRNLILDQEAYQRELAASRKKAKADPSPENTDVVKALELGADIVSHCLSDDISLRKEGAGVLTELYQMGFKHGSDGRLRDYVADKLHCLYSHEFKISGFEDHILYGAQMYYFHQLNKLGYTDTGFAVVEELRSRHAAKNVVAALEGTHSRLAVMQIGVAHYEGLRKEFADYDVNVVFMACL